MTVHQDNFNVNNNIENRLQLVPCQSEDPHEDRDIPDSDLSQIMETIEQQNTSGFPPALEILENLEK